jgi:hypothetical protein
VAVEQALGEVDRDWRSYLVVDIGLSEAGSGSTICGRSDPAESTTQPFQRQNPEGYGVPL